MKQDTTVRCNGCSHYFITHDRFKPYGCARFGFKTRSLPATVVLQTTGMQCAYRENNSEKSIGTKSLIKGRSDGR